MEAVEAADLEDVRLAVVLNGGVSLAVWIGGIAREINRLSSANGPFYRELLGLTASTVRVDVLAGTSAGGINAPALALAEVFDHDLQALGDLWVTAGGFADLLHDPMDKNPQSLLKGDGYLLVQLGRAFRALQPTLDATKTDRPVDLTVTGALWKGERVPFTDDYGSQIVESVHEVHFRFRRDDPAWHESGAGAAPATDDFANPAIVEQLALAARSTSANPFGFEASWVPMTNASDAHPPMSGIAEMVGGKALDCDRFVLDGGILVNKPVRPALEAINSLPAARQVRRVMVYVQPDPGDQSTVNVSDDRSAPPSFIGVFVASGFTLPKAQTIAGDLDDIRNHNAKARQARATRADQLEAFDKLGLKQAQILAAALLPAYRRVRARQLGDLLSRLWRQQPLPPAAGAGGGQSQPDGSRWTPEEVASVFLSGPGDDVFPNAFLPPAPPAAEAANGGAGAAAAAPGQGPTSAVVLDPNLDSWGLAPVDALAATILDISRRALWLAPLNQPDLRRAIRDLREGVHQCRQELIRLHTANDEFWRRHLQNLPARPGTPADRRDALRRWAALASTQPWVAQNRGALSGDAVAQKLVRLLVGHETDILKAASPDQNGSWTVLGAEKEADLLAKLVHGLMDPVAPIERFLALEVCRAALGQADDPGLEIALMQVSAFTPNSFGMPAEASKLAGVQLSHFGAFYKQSWRASDWIWGRLDGAFRMVQAVLDPGRLTQLGRDPEELYVALRDVATNGTGPGDARWLGEQWDLDQKTIRHELDSLNGTNPPTSLLATTTGVARRVQLEILRQELPRLVQAADADANAGARKGDRSDMFRSQYRLVAQGGQLNAADIVDLWQKAKIGEETFKTELGSDLLATTVSGVAAAAVNALESNRSGLKPLNALTRALRGLTLVVYFMLRSAVGGGFGAGATSLVLAIGGALLAVSLTVSVPPVLTLIGATIVLAGLVMAALRSGSKVFAAIFAGLVVLGVATFIVAQVKHWTHANRSTWATLGAVVGFAALAMALGSVHSKSTAPPMPAVTGDTQGGVDAKGGQQ